MRAILVLFVLLITAVTTSAVLAGNLATADGKTTWQSTSCKEPVEPASLVKADRNTGADDMNKLLQAYNGYADQMQGYMNCVNKEAEDDVTSASQAISGSAGSTIDAAQKKVSTLHDTLQAKR